MAVGHHPGQPKGTGCPDTGAPCRVPFGKGDVNLTSLLLYLNAIAYGVSGVLTLLISGWGDHFCESSCPTSLTSAYKREQYIFMLVLYGALCLPAAGLTAYNYANYTALIALYTIFSITGYLAMAWMNIFIPYTMYAAAPIDELSTQAKVDALAKTDDVEGETLRAKREREGLKMSVWGGVSMNVATVIFYCITIGISYAGATAARNAGMYMSTVAGGICIICALLGWRFLPSPGSKPYNGNFWMLPIRTFVELWHGLSRYRNAMLFLISFVIYNDSHFAYGSVIGTLFNLNARPSMTEFTAYSITGTATSIVGSLIFMYIFPYSRLSLRHWAMIAYSLTIFTTFWCCLGMSPSSKVGYKHRAEFYVFQVIMNLAGSIISPLFRVLFSEMFPRGNEIQYFGFQLVLSCGTTWIPQIANAPIVSATNNVRLPAVISLVFFIISFVLVWLVNDKEGVAIIRREEVAEAERHPEARD